MGCLLVDTKNTQDNTRLMLSIPENKNIALIILIAKLTLLVQPD